MGLGMKLLLNVDLIPIAQAACWNTISNDKMLAKLLLNMLGKELLYRHYADLKKAIASGVVDDTKAVGILDQWLIEGKYTEEEALVLSCDMLAAGMETVSVIIV
jgi:hypothetical protein